MCIRDSPYRELRFSGKPQRMLYDLDNGEGNVITLGTFSKIFMPGFRMGWVLAHPMVIDNFVKAKQSTDLCTSAFLQKITVKFFQKNYFDANVKNIVDMYRSKLEAMLGAFEKYMPEGVTWTRPEGGLFLFLTLPEGYDAEELLSLIHIFQIQPEIVLIGLFPREILVKIAIIPLGIQRGTTHMRMLSHVHKPQGQIRILEMFTRTSPTCLLYTSRCV